MDSPTTRFATILRFEGLAALGVSVAWYAHAGYSWPLFAVLFLLPDLSIAAYALNRVAGAYAYNSMHSTIGPLVVLTLGLTLDASLTPFALIWLSHVGFDRALGYGLKSLDGFHFTHLGRVGKQHH